MTGFMHEKEFSRKQFVKGGGALIVGFSMLAGKATAAPYNLIPTAANPDPFAGLAGDGPFDQFLVDSWIVIHDDNTASIKTGGVLQGTGSETGLMMIAGEELDMDMSQLVFVTPDTTVVPSTGNKAASNTIKNAAGNGTRAAAATAKQALLGLASTRLGVPTSQLSVSKGIVSGGGKSVTYGELLGGRLFNVRMPASYDMQNRSRFAPSGLLPGQAPAKPVSEYTLVGTSPPRIDIPEIVAGTNVYSQSVRLPNMLHGRVVRPQGQAVWGFGAPIISIDESSIKHIPGARVVRKKDFLGVVAPKEYDAIQAASQLKVKWADPPAVLPSSGNEFSGMRALDSAGKSIQSATVAGNVDAALASAAHVVSGSYGWPTNFQATIAPSCAIADATQQGVQILTWTQDVFKTRNIVAFSLGVPEESVRVIGFAGGGAFGYSQYQEVAVAASLMSQLAGAPVRLQLMRWDEHGWAQTSPGTLMDARAGIDGKGNIVGFDLTQFYPAYKGESVQTSAALSGVPVLPSLPAAGVTWPGAQYNIPNRRQLLKSIPLQGNWIKADWMRLGNGAHTTFAGEQVIDELARAANMDPVAFRIQNASATSTTQPMLTVLNAVTQAARWQSKVPGSNLSNGNIVMGRGIAWAPQAAAIADVTVNKTTGKVTVTHVYQAFSAGLIVYPEGVENQMVGGITQILSRLLTEQYRYNKTNVTSLDWVSYPILRFKDAPKVTPIVVQMRDTVPQGVGEPVTAAAAAAVANAFFDATGVRMRTAPFTPPRIRAALKAAGVA
jgi:nicotinate dehydrogenase subunit B